MNPEPTWQYLVRADGDTRIIVLSGEIDINGAAELHRLLQETVDPGCEVTVDVAGVTFIDSTVITAFISAQNLAGRVGCRFSVINPEAQVQRVLALTGVLGALTSGTR